MAKVEDCPGFETFGADVKAAREAKRLARKTLAEMVGIEWRYLANIENQGAIPSLPVMIQLIKICGLPVERYFNPEIMREESEIRLCEFSPKQFLMGREVELSLGARLYNYSYYVKESQLISYVDFDFSDCLDQLIKELVIGPKCLMSERDMEYYLTTLGLSNCRVKKSQGTYR